MKQSGCDEAFWKGNMYANNKHNYHGVRGVAQLALTCVGYNHYSFLLEADDKASSYM